MEQQQVLLREALGEFGPPIGCDIREWAVRRGWIEGGSFSLSSFLKNEVRCARMQSASSHRVDARVDERRARALCEELGLSAEGPTHVLLARVREKVGAGAAASETKEAYPEVLLAVNEALRDEFRIRREMMLKRCDVTVASFSCDCVHNLSKEPAVVEVGDAAALSEDRSRNLALSLERTTTTSPDEVKKHIIGEVPERGGDVSKARQQQQRQGPPQHQHKRRKKK